MYFELGLTIPEKHGIFMASSTSQMKCSAKQTHLSGCRAVPACPPWILPGRRSRVWDVTRPRSLWQSYTSRGRRIVGMLRPAEARSNGKVLSMAIVAPELRVERKLEVLHFLGIVSKYTFGTLPNQLNPKNHEKHMFHEVRLLALWLCLKCTSSFKNMCCMVFNPGTILAARLAHSPHVALGLEVGQIKA